MWLAAEHANSRVGESHRPTWNRSRSLAPRNHTYTHHRKLEEKMLQMSFSFFELSFLSQCKSGEQDSKQSTFLIH